MKAKNAGHKGEIWKGQGNSLKWVVWYLNDCTHGILTYRGDRVTTQKG